MKEGLEWLATLARQARRGENLFDLLGSLCYGDLWPAVIGLWEPRPDGRDFRDLAESLEASHA